ncbi:hypothetical protein HNY73_006142 [Argiope bruennichi]|uniref:BTB domain-containing protein n=1 Tax=Argiope bruennichi TaxID=94029 RepID=A0A8T0FLZ3_ARGBR|nr:hypothetical protein HNY73_006142 [Argiope bruennichi]
MPSENNRQFKKLESTTNFAWDINNFAILEMLTERGHLVLSPLLNLYSVNEVWKLHIYPKGQSDADYIGFYLFKTHISDQAVYNCTLSIGRPDETPVKSYKYTGVRFLDNGIGEEFFLCKKYNSWISNGSVRFRCDITKTDQKNLHSPNGSSLKSFVHFNLADTANLSLDLEELLMVPFHSDLTVSMSRCEIYVHKYILHVRCPNIRFQNHSLAFVPPNVETEINDEIFGLLMYYCYTGKLKDSFVPLELFRLAEKLKLSSLIRCLHEQSSSHHASSAADVENQVISWDLDELNFFEEGSRIAHILRTASYSKQLVIQVSFSNDCGKEKFIDISFKFLNITDCIPILLICKISLTSQSGLEAFKEDHHVFRQVDQWNFPRIPCQKDEYMYISGMGLTIELSICDGTHSRLVRNIKTKTKLLTDFQTVSDNLESLRSCMALLFQITRSTSNLILLSSDSKFFRVHDGIMWARWPGLRTLIDKSSVSSEEDLYNVTNPLELNLPSEVLDILLPYLYTGFIPSFDREKAELFLKHNDYLQFPYHLMEKCEALLSDDNGMQC